jgi:hypothetical protein
VPDGRLAAGDGHAWLGAKEPGPGLWRLMLPVAASRPVKPIGMAGAGLPACEPATRACLILLARGYEGRFYMTSQASGWGSAPPLTHCGSAPSQPIHPTPRGRRPPASACWAC